MLITPSLHTPGKPCMPGAGYFCRVGHGARRS
jgi:hypothetical protein